MTDRSPAGGPATGIGTPGELKQLKELYKQLPQLLQRMEGGRAQLFYPYLLIRSEVGDRGNRPIATRFGRSPDIWVCPKLPSQTPPIPHKQFEFQAGPPNQPAPPHTIYAHVWNLGRAPILGAKVEFYEAHVGSPDHRFVGQERVDLSARTAIDDCHKLVRCPEPFEPQNPAWSLLVRVSSIGDRLDRPDSWDPSQDRHVARLDPFLM